MLSPEDIQRLCERKYPAFLRALVTGEPFFPLEIRFGRPSTSDDWPTLQSEITSLAQGAPGYRIDWCEINTRRWGRQRMPERVWVEDEPAYLRALRKQTEVEVFRANLERTRALCPSLSGWLAANVKRVVELAREWPDLLRVCCYLAAHPRPGLYARELPVPVDTKFVERHQGVLRSLLDVLLPESAKTAAERFEDRFGLRYDEPLIRCRLLDPALGLKLGLPVDDFATPLGRFRQLGWEGTTVVIAENKMTFLTLPRVANGIGIFGGGGAAELLTSAGWLSQCRLICWGDLDVHGFHILSRLRRAFPALESVMMDLPTLEQFQEHAVRAGAAAYEEFARLTPAERAVYDRLKEQNLLLEQERIPQAWAAQRIAERVAGPAAGSLG